MSGCNHDKCERDGCRVCCYCSKILIPDPEPIKKKRNIDDHARAVDVVMEVFVLASREDAARIYPYLIEEMEKAFLGVRIKTMLQIARFFENEYDGPSDQIRELVALESES